MPRDTSGSFVTQKNRETNKPIWLYEIDMTGIQDENLFLAEYNENLSYKGDTYTAFPLSHEGIEQSSTGRIDPVTVGLSNVGREIQAWLEANDGLRGRDVTILRVFVDTINHADAYMSDVYSIDAVSISETAASFTLLAKTDVLEVQMPRRSFSRTYCGWQYKGLGCWLPATVAGTGSVGQSNRVLTDNSVSFTTSIQLGDKISVTSAGNWILNSWVYRIVSDTQIWLEDTFPASDASAIYVVSTVLSAAAPGSFDTDEEGDGDTCNHSTDDCERHNNLSRFGGFPSIPTEKLEIV